MKRGTSQLRNKPLPKAKQRMATKGNSNRTVERTKWAEELALWWAINTMPTTCEVRFDGCMGKFGAALAHSKKRRYIYTRDDYFEVVCACVKCHETLDNVYDHDEMEAVVKRIIANRVSLLVEGRDTHS